MRNHDVCSDHDHIDSGRAEVLVHRTGPNRNALLFPHNLADPRCVLDLRPCHLTGERPLNITADVDDIGVDLGKVGRNGYGPTGGSVTSCRR